jgi:hypothetical protein
VPWIVPIAVAAGIVQEGEVFDNPGIRPGQAREVQTVAAYPRPVRRPVDAAPLEPEFLTEYRDKPLGNEGRGFPGRDSFHIGSQH